ncbi:MAG: hypothetical protein AAGB12_07635 [Pseudomonadota bacterium]
MTLTTNNLEKNDQINNIKNQFTEQSWFESIDIQELSYNSLPSEGFSILEHYGVVAIDGKQAKTLLQGQLTQEMDEITTKHSSLACFCNPQGRIISLFRLVMTSDEAYLAIMPISVVGIFIENLKKYAVFYQVNINDLSNNFIILGQYLKKEAKTTFNQQQIHHESFSINVSPQGLRSVTILRLENTTPIIDELHSNQAVLYAQQDWQICENLEGLPGIDGSASEKFLPHHINLTDLSAVSFTKGCYTGQEIIARMQYRAKIKKRARLLLVNAESDSFSISDEQHKLVGEIVSFARLNTSQVLVLAIINDELIAQQTPTISIKTENGPILKILEIPYTVLSNQQDE